MSDPAIVDARPDADDRRAADGHRPLPHRHAGDVLLLPLPRLAPADHPEVRGGRARRQRLRGGPGGRRLRGVGRDRAALGGPPRRPLRAPGAAQRRRRCSSGSSPSPTRRSTRSPGSWASGSSPGSARRRCSSARPPPPRTWRPSHRRGEAASYFSVALYSGLALGPALGEHLADTYGLRRGVDGGRRWPRSLAALLGLGTPAHHAVPDEKPTSLLHRAALGPGFVLMLGLIPFTGFAAFLAVYGPDIGLDDTGAGVLRLRGHGARHPHLRRQAARPARLATGLHHRPHRGRHRRARARAVGIGRRGVGRGRMPRARHVAALPGAVLRRPRGRARPRAQPGGRHVLAVLRPLAGHRRAAARRRRRPVRRAGRVPGGRAHRRRRVLGAAPPPPRARATAARWRQPPSARDRRGAARA